MSGSGVFEDYREIRYPSDDGLELYARDYPNDAARLTLLCLHGLTRNSADFEHVAAELAADYRVVVPDQRGRGQSQWDSNPDNYTPARYVADMFTLIGRLGLRRIVPIGTSMGGLMSMMMVNEQPPVFRGLALNDIGPEIAPAGLARIMGHVGKAGPVKTWDEAAAAAANTNAVAFPGYGRQDWMRWARRTYAKNAAGELQLLYDPAIAEQLAGPGKNAAPPDAWALFDGLRRLPLLTIHGELSDILDQACCARMRRKHPGMTLVTLPGVGHAPMLDEPGAIRRLKVFLNGIESDRAAAMKHSRQGGRGSEAVSD